MPPLRIANLIRDAEIVGLAKQDAAQMLEKDPGLSHDEKSKD